MKSLVDRVVVEEPLSLQVAGDTIAVTMRTPGHDRELALGFLYAEGIIHSHRDVVTVTHCGRLTDASRAHTLRIELAAGISVDLDDGSARRSRVATSSCGFCGRRAIDDLLARLPEPVPAPPIDPAGLSRVVAALSMTQPLFRETGGSHAAALFSPTLEHIVTYEDIGRHNALDKVVGDRLLHDKLPLSGHTVVVSGRASFEIVQKSLMAGVSVLVSVSTASSLAIELAQKAGLMLLHYRP